MKHGLSPTTVQGICSIFACYPHVKKAVLYGSRAKGDFTTGSDIDLVLFGGKDLSLNVVFKILDEIDELYLPYTIDLSIYNNISDSNLIDHIQRVGCLFYEKKAEDHALPII